MAKRQSINMDSYFSGAEKIHQLSQAEAEIQRLQAEIIELRATGSVPEMQLDTLRTHLKSSSGMSKVALEQIQPNPTQPRQTFLPESIEAIARSLEREGQLQPIILIEPVESGEKYLIFDGERRWRGASLLKWISLDAVIIPLPTALHRQTLLTSLHREDLNPLDKAEAILKEIAQNTQITSEDIPRLLSAAIRRLTKQGKLTQLSSSVISNDALQREILETIQLSEPEQKIIWGLLTLQLNPASIDANIFPMLALAGDLKQAIREQGLKAAQALALQQLSAKNLLLGDRQAEEIRKAATTKVIEQKLSVAQTRKLVKQIKEAHNNTSTQKENDRSLSALVKNMEQLSFESLAELEKTQLENLQQTMKKKLEEIAVILQQRNI